MIDNFLYIIKFLEDVVRGEELERGEMNSQENPLSFCWDDLPIIDGVTTKSEDFYRVYGMEFYRDSTISELMVTLEDQIDYLKQ